MRCQRGCKGVAGTIMALLACTGIEPAWAEAEKPAPLPSAPSPVAPQPAPARPVASTPLAGPAPSPMRYERYGLQILAADAVSLGLCIGAIAADSRSVSLPLFLVGMGSWLVLPPIVHGVHRNGKGALSSLLARPFIPSTTMLMVLGLTGSSSSSGDLAAAGMGVLVGVIAIEVIDSVFWARTPVPAPPVSLAVVPYHDGATLALGARF